MASFNVLITGSNRGLGKGLLEAYLARLGVVAVAAVRKPDDQTVKDLARLPKGDGSKLIVVKIDSEVATDALEAIGSLKAHYGIDHLDLVIANAGSVTGFPLVADARADDMLRIYNINVVAPMLLFQATRELLLASKAAPGGKFVGVTSAASWQTNMAAVPWPNAAYGPSKTALNYVLQKAHFENQNLVIVPLDPGFVATDMGIDAARAWGVPGGMPPQTLEQTIPGMVQVMDKATREETGGKLITWEGTISEW